MGEMAKEKPASKDPMIRLVELRDSMPSQGDWETIQWAIQRIVEIEERLRKGKTG